MRYLLCMAISAICASSSAQSIYEYIMSRNQVLYSGDRRVGTWHPHGEHGDRPFPHERSDTTADGDKSGC